MCIYCTSKLVVHFIALCYSVTLDITALMGDDCIAHVQSRSTSWRSTFMILYLRISPISLCNVNSVIIFIIITFILENQ